MPRCRAHKPDGTPCARLVGAQREFCFAHDPSKAEARSRVAASGGRGKAAKEVRTLKAEIKDLIAGVRTGIVDRSDAACMISGYRALRDYLELERRVEEQDELLRRVAELEAAQQASAAGNGARTPWVR